MGDRLATIEGGAGSPSNTKSTGRGIAQFQVTYWSMQRLGRNRCWPKIRGLCPFGGGGAGSPSNTMWPGRGLPARQVSSWSVQPFGHSARTLQTDNGPI